MNILNLSTFSFWNLGPGKGRVSTYLPLKGFIGRGHNVYYISDSRVQESGMFENINVNKIKTPFVGKRIYLRVLFYPVICMCFLYASLKCCKKNRPDVVYAHSTETALPAFLIAKLFKAKYVLRLYGVGCAKIKRFKVSSIFLHIAFVLKADLYILTNDGTAADMVAFSFGVPRDKVHFLRNGINKEWAESVVDENLRKKVAPNGEKILLSVSRLANSKQVDLIIKTFSELIRINDNVRLLIVGDGEEMANLKRLSKELDVDKSILFTGGQPQTEINKYMKIADAFISMNALSSLSNPVFEAMVCGIPVIALDRGTTSEFITNNENGILIEDKYLQNLPEIINDLFTNDQLHESIVKTARKNMLENWPSWTDRVNYEIDIVEKLIK